MPENNPRRARPSSKKNKWFDYQLRCADFFSNLGLGAQVDYKVHGARADHKIDVYAEGRYLGIEFKWIVECKAWKTNVSKEKVLALAAIVDDVGADKGILLSEKGFQPGAIRAATKTNIVLTSVDDLEAVSGEHLRGAAIKTLYWRWNKLKTALWQARRENAPFPDLSNRLNDLIFLELPFADVANGATELSMSVGNSLYVSLSVDGFISKVSAIVSDTESWLAAQLPQSRR